MFTGFAPRIDGVLDDHVETWFLTGDEPPGPAAEGLDDVVDLGLESGVAAAARPRRVGPLLRDLTAEQAVGRTARPELDVLAKAGEA